MRIISDDLWEAVKLRQAEMRELMNLGTGDGPHRPERTRRPDYLLSGLMRCACCGAGYTLINKNRYGCAASRTKGKSICTNRSTILREEVEARVLEGLQKKLMHPKLIAAFVKEYVKAMNEAAGAQTAAFEKARRDLVATQKKIDGIVDAIADGMYHPSMKAKMSALEETKARLTAELADQPEPPALRLHPSMAARYSEEVERLSAALYDQGLRFEASNILRSLIDEIRMIPDPITPAKHDIELIGHLAGILHLMDANNKRP
ncbi:zinc ribbon domain-containing protein, partial [Falsigemmobacter intermedius]